MAYLNYLKAVKSLCQFLLCVGSERLHKRETDCLWIALDKGGFTSEDTGKLLRLQHKYSKSLSWAENLNKLFAVLGGKFKFSSQDSDLEYLFMLEM